MGQPDPSTGAEPRWLFTAGEEVDQFHVIRSLGQGGMAQVFLARDTRLGRKVALKVVRPGALGSRQAIDRFLFEARATARINHPNIVTVYSVGEREETPYVALEYVQGQTLRERMDQEQLGDRQILRIALAIAEALEAAHAEAIIHRDLKPDNVMLGRDGRLRVLDFGLARMVEAAATAPDAETASLAHDSTVQLPFESRDGGVRGTPRLWDVAGRGPRRPPPVPPAVGLVRLSPDSAVLASTNNDNRIWLWDVATQSVTAILQGHGSDITDLRFHPGGGMLATSSRDRTIRLWDVGARSHLATLEGHTGGVWAVSFSPDGRLLASAGMDSTVRLWDVASRRQLATLKHASRVTSVWFSPDSERLASASYDRTVRLWNVRTHREVSTIEGVGATLTHVRFGPDGRLLALIPGRTIVRIQDLKTRSVIRSLPHPQRVLWPEYVPGAELVGAPCSDGTAHIWNLATGSHRVLRGHRGPVDRLSFSRDGHRVATSGEDGAVRIWDAQTGRPLWRAPLMRAALRAKRGASPGERAERAGFALPELCTHRGWTRLDGGGKASTDGQKWRRAVESRAHAADESLDGSTLCVATHEGELELWDIAGDRRLRSVRLPGASRVLALSGRCLVLARGKAQLVDRASRVRELVGAHARAIWRDGHSILVATRTGVQVFSTGGRLRYQIDARGGITALGGSADRLALGFQDGTVQLFSARTRKRQKLSLENVPSSQVERILFGPKSTLILGHANGELGIWSLFSGKRLKHGRLLGPVVHLMLQKGRLYAASELGSHLVWDLRVLEQDYCELMREVWRRVPVLWEGGLPVLRAPPGTHRCTADKP